MRIRLFLGYKPVQTPGGGANNFLRALYVELRRGGKFEIVSSLAEADIVFMNQLNAGEGNDKYRLDEILRLRNSPGPSGRPPRIVVRAVNLRHHSYGFGIRNWLSALRDDSTTLKLLNSADFVIFQSHYQQAFFTQRGFASPSYRIIHNGANPIFLALPRRTLSDQQRIQLVSATASPRQTKRHDIIRSLAACEGVDVCHFGRWPAGMPSGQVKLMGVCTHEEMHVVYGAAHGFIHPAVKDPCPNAVVEALASGLPVLYGDGVGSSAELVREHGIRLAAGNPDAGIQEFRARYWELTGQLEQDRSAYCIGRAADEYSNVLECVAS